jgi:diguanylate cyclase (GGDEF)-like protein
MSETLLARMVETHGAEALSDVLTGCFNRRLLNALLIEHWDGLRAESPTLSLILIDLDRFKEVNDT